MIYSIIMLSRSHKTDKIPSTESKIHTGSCFPLTAPVPPGSMQHKLPLLSSETPWQVTGVLIAPDGEEGRKTLSRCGHACNVAGWQRMQPRTRALPTSSDARRFSCQQINYCKVSTVKKEEA